VAGDDVHAQFGFASGVTGTFTSNEKQRNTVGHWGLGLIGNKATARILADIPPRILLLKAGAWTENGRSDSWEEPDSLKVPAVEKGFGPGNRRVVDDWLAAISENRQPACSGLAGMKAVEMVMAVYASAISNSRVALPLVKREHPLA
jgi:predicted dehydrogenase